VVKVLSGVESLFGKFTGLMNSFGNAMVLYHRGKFEVKKRRIRNQFPISAPPLSWPSSSTAVIR